MRVEEEEGDKEDTERGGEGTREREKERDTQRERASYVHVMEHTGKPSTQRKLKCTKHV